MPSSKHARRFPFTLRESSNRLISVFFLTCDSKQFSRLRVEHFLQERNMLLVDQPIK